MFLMYSSAVTRVIYKNARTMIVIIEKHAMQKRKGNQQKDDVYKMLEICAREGGSSVVEMRAATVYRREILLKICKKADKIDGGRKETVVSKERKKRKSAG